MNSKFLYFLVGALSGGLGVHAQDVRLNSNLKGLINQSFTFYPKMNEVQNAIAVAQQGVVVAASNTLNVNGEAAYTYVRPKVELGLPLGANGEVTTFLFAPVHAGDANVNASYTLLDFGRLKANVDKSKADLKLATDNVDYLKNQLAYQVANIYYNIVYYKKAIIIEDSVINYLQQNKRIIDSKLKNGDAIRLDLLNVQSSLDNEQNNRENLRNALQKQFVLLQYTTGVTIAEGNAFDFDIAAFDVDAAVAAAQANNPDFQLAKDKVAQSQSELAATQLDMKPSVVLHGATGYKNGYVPEVSKLRYNYNAGVTLNVPIYSGGKMKKQIALNQLQVKQNELAIESLNNDYKRDIAQAFTDVKTNEERIRNTTGQIDAAIAAEKLAADRYLNGVGTNLEITNASTNVQRAEFSRLQYEYQLCLAKVQLSKLLGYKYW